MQYLAKKIRKYQILIKQNFEMEINIKGLIKKYTWLLIVYYILTTGFSNIPIYDMYFMTNYFKFSAKETTTMFLIIDYLSFIINILISIIMFIDYKKYKIKNKWTIILALIYIPIGLIVFFVNILFGIDDNKYREKIRQ